MENRDIGIEDLEVRTTDIAPNIVDKNIGAVEQENGILDQTVGIYIQNIN